MKNIIKSFIYIVMLISQECLFSNVVFAQESPSQSFKYLTTSNGFENKTVMSIHQDARGFMWFGTKDGLYKYDGSKLNLVCRNFFDNKENVMNVVKSIEEDRQHQQLLLIVNNSLFTLDLQTENIEPVEPLKDESVLSMFIDNNQHFWLFLKDKGLYIYHKENGKIEEVKSFDSLGRRSFVQIKQDSLGVLYFLDPSNGVVSLEPNSDKMEYYTQDKIYNKSFCVDQNGNLWLGTWNGLFCWDSQNAQFKSVPLNSSKNSTALTITDIVEKESGELFLATNNGIYIYQTDTKSAIHFKHDSFLPGTLNYNYVNTIFFDRENTLWAGTYFGGVNYMAENSRNFMRYDVINKEMSGKVVSGFAEDGKGNLWISTEDGGISFYDFQINSTTNFNPQESDSTFLDFYNVHCLLMDKDTLFIGMTNTGLSAYNVKEQTMRKVSSLKDNNHLLSDYTIFSLTKINENEIAIGTPVGVNIYNQQKNYIYKVNDIPNRNVTCIKRDSQDGLWACGWDLGVYYKPKGKKWMDFCKDNPNMSTKVIYTLTQYGENIYIGTKNNGVISYNLKNKKYNTILRDCLHNVSVFNIIPYEQDLWICTSNGLYQYNLTNSSYRHFGEVNGIKSIKACYNAGIVTSKNCIFIGTINGLNGFSPKDLIFSQCAPITFFTDLKINNEVITPQSSQSPLKKVMPYTNKITLNNSQANITVKFTSTCYYGKEGVVYKYKLLPEDKLWNFTHSNVVNFSHLAPGEYRLSVYSCNSDGLWDEKGSHLSITVLPPWWASWYMILCYVILILSVIIWQLILFRKKQKRQLEKINIQKSKEIYQTKIEFFTNMIHEIRTPLTLILSPLKVLRSREDTHPFKYELDMIQRNSERLLNNINQLMDFRKAEQDVSVYKDFEPIDIVQEIYNICDDFKYAAIGKGVDLQVINLCGNAPCYILGEKEILNKIFSNLISNALKFTKSEIKIEMVRLNEKVAISVQDDGIGISKDLQDHIFEPFYQIRDQLPKDYIGTGIGLSIVKNLVKKIKGELSLFSKVNQGALFTVSLPLNDDVNDDVVVTSKKEEVEIVRKSVSENICIKRIAVVEDNDDMRSFTISLLKDKYEVLGYRNGEEACEQIGKENFDVILSDIMMPKMDGYELCKWVKTNPATCHVPVILLTAKILEQDEIEGLEIGADAYIRKPFSPDILLAQIENLIMNRERLLTSFQENPATQLIDIISDNKDKEFVAKVNEIIYDNLSNPDLSVQFVASEMCVSRSLFFIKIKGISGMTFTDYVRIARLKKAVELLKEGTYSIIDIANMTGFSSPSYFCKCFKKQFKMSTGEYLKTVSETIS